jgi:hypothetical protein
MTKYLIEGNIDFYEELYKSLHDKNDNKDEDLCLITNLPLTENYIILECNHKFNYVPLFNDLVARKNKNFLLETEKLKINEIRCPYCRNKQQSLLPYYENMNVAKVHGINFNDETETNCMYGVCSFIIVTTDIEHPCACINHYVYKFQDEKTYCSYHLKIVQRNLLKEKFLKQKAEIKKLQLENKMKKKYPFPFFRRQ